MTARIEKTRRVAGEVRSYTRAEVYNELQWALPIGPSARRDPASLRYIATLATRAAHLIETEDAGWLFNLPQGVYDLASERSEKLHGIGLMALHDDGYMADVIELVEQATADLAGGE